MATSGGQDATRQKWLLDRQRSMIKRAAREGLSNLVQFALQLHEAEEVDPRLMVEPRGEEDVPLVTACLAGHLDVVKNLVEKCEASVNCRANVEVEGEKVDGVTPLWAAAYSGNLELVRYLVEKGAALQESTKTKSTPLRVAAYDGHLPVVRYLVEQGADVNSVNFIGHSILMAACYKERKEIVQFLLDRGADVNYTVPEIEGSDLVGETVLHNCARTGNVEIAKLLVEHGALITRKVAGETALMMAAYNGHDDLVNYLADTPDCSRDEKADALELLGTYYLDLKEADIEKCLSLWKRAMEVRQQPGKPEARKMEAKKKVAAYQNAVEVQTMAELKKLLTGPDVYQVEIQGLLVRERVLGPAHDETIGLIKMTAARYADEDKFDRTMDLILHAISSSSAMQPFHEKSLSTCYFAVEILVAMFDSEHDQSSLFNYAILLLGHCADVIGRALKDPKLREQKEDFTKGCHAVIKIMLHLIFLGLQTQCHVTSQERQQLSQAVQGLVGMSVRGNGGATPLHLACVEETSRFCSNYKGFIFPATDVVKALLKAGCDVNAPNNDGQTALQVALAENNGRDFDITKILRVAGAM